MLPGQEVSIEIEGIGTLTNLGDRQSGSSPTDRRRKPSSEPVAIGPRRPGVLGDLAPEQVRVRFPPSPTGNLHVGNVRSALFNWVFARHYGGTFVLRVEDTDAGRNLAESYAGLYDSLDLARPGPGTRARSVGGPYGPYIQSERGDIYARRRGRSCSTPGWRTAATARREEIEAREAARPKGAPSGYDGFCRDLTPERVAELEALSARRRWSGCGCPIARDRVRRPGPRPGHASTPSTCPTTCIVRANGEPLYTLVNPVDDALMEITHVLRGEDLLPSTPRQIVLYQALAADRRRQRPDADLRPPADRAGRGQPPAVQAGQGRPAWPSTRSKGYLPEAPAQLPGPARLGASPTTATSSPSPRWSRRFDIRRVNANPARFDAEEVRGDQRRAHPAADRRSS